MSKVAGKKRASPGADEPKVNPLEDVTLSAEQEEKLEKAQKDVDRADLVLERRTNAYLKPIWEKRRPVLKEIDNFWPVAFKNHAALNLHIQHKEDVLALTYLQDVWIAHDPTEFRAFTIEFHFKENPFFSDPVLKKVYQYKPPESFSSDAPDEDGITEASLNFSWDRDIEVQSMTIAWKSDAKALTKLHPRVTNEEDDDTVPEVGSFFHFFEQKEDPFDIGNTIAQEIFPDAINFFLGKVEQAGELDDEDSEEDEEDDEDEEEIDLEKPRKKVKKA